jgi:hypothetical protein
MAATLRNCAPCASRPRESTPMRVTIEYCTL